MYNNNGLVYLRSDVGYKIGAAQRVKDPTTIRAKRVNRGMFVEFFILTKKQIWHALNEI